MDNFIPKLTTEAKAQLQTNIQEGQFIITKDGKKIYVDISNSERISIGGSSEGSLKKITSTIGDGSTTTFNVTHNLNTVEVYVSCVNTTSNENCWIEYKIIDVNTIQFVFKTAPAAGQYRITVIG